MQRDSIVEKSLIELLEEFRVTSTSEADKGSKFERLTKFYLIKDPIWAEQLTNVRLREEANIGPDVGIDLVADDIASGGKVAIQCKFYDEKTYLHDLGTFYTSSGKDGYVKRIVVATSNQWTRNAEEALKDQQIPVQRILLHDMEQSLISWGAFDLSENYGSVPIAQKELRPHQIDALTSVMSGFSNADRGKVIMACGTGKTLVSLRIAEEFFKNKEAPSTVLFLAPSISLLSQTIMEWGQNKKSAYMALAVCSDAKVGKKDDDDMQVTDLAIPASTDTEKLAAALENRGNKDLVIFSTYQSLEIISRAQKDKRNILSQFDLVVCDEAHRTTGVTTAAKAAVEDFSHFVRVHDNEYVNASKRLYMTATPKIYKDVDNKVAAAGGVIASMDDPEKFGEEFYRLGFGTAVERGLLSDYRVLILAIDEEYVAQVDLERFRSEDSTINLDDASKLLGCWRGLSKIKTQGEDVDEIPMKRAVAFANTIDASQVLAKRLEIVGRTANRPTEGNAGLSLQTRHVDGKQNALVRRQSLEWLKADPGPLSARILTNARCLSEGIDVPALDAVIFTEARGSQVDIVQAVGRVMRKHEGKNSGYIILPVAITAGADINSTLKGTKYKVIWDVLNALRAHDDRFDVIVNQINLNQNRDSKIEVDVVTGEDDSGIATPEEFEQGILVHLPSQIADGIYAKIVEKVGDREYWEQWAHDVADIAHKQEVRIRSLLSEPNSKPANEFDKFLKAIRDNLNDSITETDAIEMLAQHLITKPIFESLFGNNEFAQKNPISRTLDGILEVLYDHIENDVKLDQFYSSVQKRVAGIDNSASRQKLITELYEKFFKIAFPRMTEKLGIVYTPIEVVDFILHSVSKILEVDFNASFSDKGVSVLDPFTGTGTFITRLLQSDLINSTEIERKYREEIFANEIVLLAYYIAAINIESAFTDLSGGTYLPFNGMVLTDTFQMFESDDTLDLDVFVANNERAEEQKNKKIKVIIGNPPYSVGQKDANDDNQNVRYPDLDRSIKNSYAKNSSASLLMSLYDSYIRAFRWATNRLDTEGIVCFVTNGTFLDAKSADGFRKSLFDEFTQVYILNLRGGLWNKRGEAAKAEGGNVFGQGSMTTIAITLLVRNPNTEKSGFIKYFEVDDYLTKDEKLAFLARTKDFQAIEWLEIEPNEHNDWVNQRSKIYESFIPFGDKKNKGKESQALFKDFTIGLKTHKDAWTYNYSKESLTSNIKSYISNYMNLQSLFQKGAMSISEIKRVPKDQISWSPGVLQRFEKGKNITFYPDDLCTVQYRPFAKRHGYRNEEIVERQCRRSIFPNGKENISIATTNVAQASFSALIVSGVFDLGLLLGDSYPLYNYGAPRSDHDESQTLLSFEESGNSEREYAITDWAQEVFRREYSDGSIDKESIFYYTYAVISSPEFVSRFEQDARKSGPRLPLLKNFWDFERAGRKLSNLHINYEERKVPSYGNVVISEDKVGESELYEVDKMAFLSSADKSVIRYNRYITVTNIPLEAYDFKVNGRSAIEWVMNQYRFAIDKDTQILSDPNLYSSDPKWILNLLLNVISLSMESREIYQGLPKFDFLNSP
jgi:predicted helicase